MNFNEYLVRRLGSLSIAQSANKAENTTYDPNGIYNVSVFSSASAEEMKNIDYAKLLDSEGRDINKGVTDQNQKSLNSILKGFLELEDVQKAADADGDGKVTEEELQAYIQTVLGKDGDASTFTMADIDAVMEEMGIDLEKAAEKSMEEALEEATKALKEEAQKEIEETKAAQQAQQAQQSARSGGASGGGGVSSTGGASSASQAQKPSGIDAMSLEELETEKANREKTVAEKQEAVNAVHSGDNEKVKAAKDEMDKAKEAYEEALDKDKNVPQELKDKQVQNTKDIEAKETSISEKEISINNKETEISSQENTVSSRKSELDSLKGSLSSLPSPSGKEEDKDKDAEIAEKKSSIESQIKAKESEVKEAEEKLDKQNEELDKLEEEKKALEEEKAELEKAKEEIQKEIEKTCSEETKAAMSAYNEAKANVDTVKQSELSTATSELDSAKASVKEIDEKITEVKNKEVAKENSVNKFDFDFSEKLSDYNKQELEQLKNIFEKNKDKYEKVAEETGIPAELICAIHYREGSCNFDTYLHNGDPLGKPTTHVPANIYFEDWSEAAIDAIKSQNPEIVKDGDFGSCMEFAERYNGLGYRNKGLASPYVWAGTTKYTGGMYVADGQFSASAYDKRIGVAVAMKYLMQ